MITAIRRDTSALPRHAGEGSPSEQTGQQFSSPDASLARPLLRGRLYCAGAEDSGAASSPSVHSPPEALSILPSFIAFRILVRLPARENPARVLRLYACTVGERRRRRQLPASMHRRVPRPLRLRLRCCSS
ncbi:hypothetical protein IscW_ISCW023269 [Ixodes scapularis]|uniref:Uncharacterized protein n=1 Tax=Ixodes scapularis TaxID=6945 RepID=B7QJV9_IXOSC|nr:hypothetical protein IscW_ISCW023269 [Ixodes scapularis]|eukprot:XP_002415466.1 hypothetical protein IscW_ISCW023269 [Ixodes scapularis]